MTAPALMPTTSAAVALLAMALLTCVLRDQVTAEGYSVANLREEATTLGRRLTWLEVQFGQRLADPSLGAPVALAPGPWGQVPTGRP